ncbi:DMT family transporter [Ideonella sp. DXS29W]|uniref:DMT family transporter n=1 Tax=Ideonella lacteola TaxID=2984193 RepID=A0ABU9BKJ7_9BURK
MRAESRPWPALALVLNAFIWGTSWWAFRQLHEKAGLHPLWTTAGIYLMAVVVIAGSRPAALTQFLRTPALWLIMLASGTTNATFNWGVTVGDVVRVVLLFYLMPLWTVLLARLMLHEKPSAAALLRVALAIGGAAFVLWPEDGRPMGPPQLTDMLGLIGGFSFALNNVMLRRESRRSESARALAMFFGGTVVSAALACAIGPPQVPAPGTLAPSWLGFAAALGGLFLLSNMALQYGAARLPANATAVIMLTEVVFASASALALGAGAITPAVAVGGALILGAAALAAWRP